VKKRAVEEGIPDRLITGLALVVLILAGIGILSPVLYVTSGYGYNVNGTVTNNTPSNSTDINNVIMFMNVLSPFLSPTGLLLNYEP
jgi:hypothetical protein